MQLLWSQVHIPGKFKRGETPNRAEIESVLKAGGARIVDASEAASADLAIVHPSLKRDHAEVRLCHTCYQHHSGCLPSLTEGSAVSPSKSGSPVTQY